MIYVSNTNETGLFFIMQPNKTVFEELLAMVVPK
jgi:hypothetical protein